MKCQNHDTIVQKKNEWESLDIQLTSISPSSKYCWVIILLLYIFHLAFFYLTLMRLLRLYGLKKNIINNCECKHLLQAGLIFISLICKILACVCGKIIKEIYIKICLSYSGHTSLHYMWDKFLFDFKTHGEIRAVTWMTTSWVIELWHVTLLLYI